MRQTGRTTRIVNHITEQLFSVGRCIATDHTAYEYDRSKITLLYLIERVKKNVSNVNSSTDWKLEHKEVEVNGVLMIDFRLSKPSTNKSNEYNNDDLPF